MLGPLLRLLQLTNKVCPRKKPASDIQGEKGENGTAILSHPARGEVNRINQKEVNKECRHLISWSEKEGKR